MKQITICAFAALMVLSCSKNNTTPTNQNPTPSPNPNPNPTPTNVIDETKLKAKWEVTSNYTLQYDSTGKVIDANGLSQTYSDNGIGWVEDYKTFITFNSDNSYDHVNKDGSPGGPLLSAIMENHGAWQLKSGNKMLQLEIKGGNLDLDVAEFKDNYMHLTYTDTMYADKQKAVFHYEFKR